MDAEELRSKKCIPCKGGVAPLQGAELARLQAALPEWPVLEEHHIRKEFSFRNFVEALAFVNRVGELAERQGHHPDLFLTWGKVEITLWTHKVDGLTESDFVMAAHIDAL